MDREALIRNIQRAIQTERDGNLYYMRAAEATKDSKAEAMFNQLARDELYHINVLEDFYSDLLQNVPGERVEGFPIFEDRKKELGGAMPEFGNDYEVLQKALSDEIEARDYYRKKAGQFEEIKAKDLFLDLAEMEEGHVRLLQAEIDFLEKTGFYFDHMEFDVEGEKG
ncbi:MAG: ferritin family protein [Deltaproteobacteria bacterium]|nr:ferritin family protein [Deltaproteobacteria bacterium]